MIEHPAYYDRLAAAYVRGRIAVRDVPESLQPLWQAPLAELAPTELQAMVDYGLAQELRLHRFKRTMGLERVRKVLGMLRGIGPDSLLDIGSGRGAFLWPLLDEFPWLPITAVDLLDYRVADMVAVRDGGIANLTPLRADATALPFADDSFAVITALEVVEHIPDTERALRELCRVAQRAVILSVPSQPDNNPEHLHLFDAPRLERHLREAGAQHVNFDYVLNHIIAAATLAHNP